MNNSLTNIMIDLNNDSKNQLEFDILTFCF